MRKTSNLRFGARVSRVQSGPVSTSIAKRHLDPFSTLHAIHSYWSKKEKSRKNHDIETGRMPDSSSEYMEPGICLDCFGKEIPAGLLDLYLEEEIAARSYYVRMTNKGGGRIGPKNEKVAKPIHKDSLTLSGEHDLILRNLADAGVNHIDHLKATGVKVMNLQGEIEGMDMIGFIWHFDSGCLHGHPIWSQVSREKKLLYRDARRGSNRFVRAGIALIAGLRVCDSGYWPESDRIHLDQYLADREERAGRLPTDYILSAVIDNMNESYFAGLSKRSPQYDFIIESSRETYKNHILARRDRRMLAMDAEAAITDFEMISSMLNDLTISRAKKDLAKGAEPEAADLLSLITEFKDLNDKWRIRARERSLRQEKRKKANTTPDSSQSIGAPAEPFRKTNKRRPQKERSTQQKAFIEENERFILREEIKLEREKIKKEREKRERDNPSSPTNNAKPITRGAAQTHDLEAEKERLNKHLRKIDPKKNKSDPKTE